MALKNITIRIDEAQAENLKKDFRQISTAVQLIIEPHDRLRKVAIQELKGYFTKEEITALIDSQNGTMLTSDYIYNKAFLLAQLEDFETLESGISRHGANPQKLFEKIKNLNSSTVYLIVMDIYIFWIANKNLESYLETWQEEEY